jgi:hypothetical protein
MSYNSVGPISNNDIGSYKQKKNLMAASKVVNMDGDWIIDRTDQDVSQYAEYRPHLKPMRNRLVRNLIRL